MDTWLPRIGDFLAWVTVGLWAAIIADAIYVDGKPPIWLFLTTMGVNGGGAIVAHIYNVAHDSLPPD